MHPRRTLWTEDRIETLHKLFAEGCFASEIADRLGVSRNAVCGKLARLGLTRETVRHPVRNTKPASPRAPRKPADQGSVGSVAYGIIHRIKAKQNGTRAPNVPLPESIIADDSGCLKIPFSALESGDRKCRWPFDASAEVEGSFVFCGLGTAEDAPFCPRHGRIAYQAPSDRRRERSAA